MSNDTISVKPGLDRRRMLALTGGVAAGGMVGWYPAPAAAARSLRWGSSSIGSSAYVIVEALVQTVGKYTDLRGSSLATAGTAENMALIGNGDLELAHSTSGDWVAATRGLKPYAKPVVAHQLFGDAAWHLPPMVHADSDIRSLAELAGKRYSPSQPGSGTGLIYHSITKAAGIYDEIDWVYGSWTEVYDAFKARQIDAVAGVLTNGERSDRIIQAEAATAVRALEIPEDVMRKVQEENPGILSELVSPDVWPALEKPTLMPMLVGVIASHPSVTAEEGYAITKAVLDHAEEVRAYGRPLGAITLELAVGRLMPAFPVNAGAAQYFKEQGVWREELKIAG